jgi:hypothetical protein
MEVADVLKPALGWGKMSLLQDVFIISHVPLFTHVLLYDTGKIGNRK